MPGTFYDAEGPFLTPNGQASYRLKWMTPEGRIIWFSVDANSGRVLGGVPAQAARPSREDDRRERPEERSYSKRNRFGDEGVPWAPGQQDEGYWGRGSRSNNERSGRDNFWNRDTTRDHDNGWNRDPGRDNGWNRDTTRDNGWNREMPRDTSRDGAKYNNGRDNGWSRDNPRDTGRDGWNRENSRGNDGWNRGPKPNSDKQNGGGPNGRRDHRRGD